MGMSLNVEFFGTHAHTDALLRAYVPTTNKLCGVHKTLKHCRAHASDCEGHGAKTAHRGARVGKKKGGARKTRSAVQQYKKKWVIETKKERRMATCEAKRANASFSGPSPFCPFLTHAHQQRDAPAGDGAHSVCVLRET